MTSTTTTTRTTHWIPAEKLAELTKKIASLAAKATKRGLAPVALVVLGYEVRMFRQMDELTGEIVELPVRCAQVAVEGDVPRLNGWSFVATLHHMESATIALGANCDVPEGAAEREPACEHCNVKRARRDTYLLRHDDGSWKQVGSTCLTAFFADATAERLALAAEWLGEAEGFARSYGSVCIIRAKGSDLRNYLAFAAMASELHGYVSNGEAYDHGGQSTADRARHAMSLTARWETYRAHPGLLPGASQDDRDAAAKLLPSEAAPKPEFRHILAAQGAINYALGLQDCEIDEYRRTLRMIAQVGLVDGRTAGYAASMLGAEKRDRERAERVNVKARRAEMDAASVHLGEVGKKTELVVVVGFVKEIESAYGLCHLHLMRDAAGNVVKWFASSKPLAPGACLRVTAIVKAHETYNNVRQTQLKNVKVVGPAAKPAWA